MAPPSDPSSAPPKNGAGPEAILKHVKDRKVVQWGFAYVAGAWLLLEILGHVTDTFGWSAVVDKVALSLAGLGLLLVLVLSWYHGEQGRQRVSGPELLIIALLLLLSGGALTILRGRGEDVSETSSASEDPVGDATVGPAEARGDLVANRVFVSLFDNQTGDPGLDPAGRMAAEYIIRDLMQTGVVEVLPIDLAVAVAGDGTAGPGESGSLLSVARKAGASVMVSGSFFAQGDSLVVQGQILDVDQERILVALEPVTASRAEPGEGMTGVAQRASGAVASLVDPTVGGSLSRLSPPGSYAAYAEFSAGIDAFGAGEYQRALERFDRARELDSTYLSPILLKSVALRNLGRSAAADTVRLMAERFRDQANTLERANLDIQRAWHDGDREAAYRAAERMADLSPGGTGEYQFGLEAIRINRPAKAVEILEGMDPDRPDVARWRPYWYQLTQAYHMLGKYPEELEAAGRAEERFPGEAPMAYRELRALLGLGRLSEVLEGAELLLSRSENRNLLLNLALELRAHGHPDAAEEVLDEAAAWYEAHSTDPATPRALRAERASALYLKGLLEEARGLYQELYQEDQGELTYLGRLGTIAARLGDLEEASRISEELAATEGTYSMRETLFWQACIAAVLGDADGAVTLLQRAHDAGFGYGLWLHFDPDLASINGHPGFEEFRRPKG